VKPVEWREGAVRVLDQRKLPASEEYVEVRDAGEMAEAIRTLAVRGAPLLGIAAGFGMALAAGRSRARGPEGLLRDLDRAGRLLTASRPTAVNVAWAVQRVRGVAGRAVAGGLEAVRRSVLEEALRIAREDEASCAAIAEYGAPLIPAGAKVLTHCNTGALATGGCGSAQGIITAAHQAGRDIHVWVDETRPLLQGARLTAWELQRLRIPMTLVADVAAGSLMARGLVDLVIVGADRIAANGDAANKIGTYQLAVLAAHHGLPFYLAAPVSTIDPAIPDGAAIVVEERDPSEVTRPFGMPLAPAGTAAANPAFDVTPAGLITAIVTDRGVARPPYGRTLRNLADRSSEDPPAPERKQASA
jgi:methylthioribose-1-phosphate isomerase